jgi:hypothetical protein
VRIAGNSCGLGQLDREADKLKQVQRSLVRVQGRIAPWSGLG